MVKISKSAVLLASGLEDAFVGIGRRCGQEDIAVYSIQKAIEILKKDGITEGEAREYLEFNSIGAWVGQLTPIWLESMTMDEFKSFTPGVEISFDESDCYQGLEEGELDATGRKKEVSVH